MKRILFQGDSVTDVDRRRDNDIYAGHGYATMVKGRLGLDHPGAYEFFNRGVGGNRSVDVYARIQCDIINLRPDVLSVLIGINDVWHEYSHHNGVAADKFERIYDMLLEEVEAALPQPRVPVLEPLAPPGTATQDTAEIPDRLSRFVHETALRAQAAHRVAEKHGATFVPLQARFDRACEQAEPSYWLHDGVHPTAMGHELIARAWVEAFEQMQRR